MDVNSNQDSTAEVVGSASESTFASVVSVTTGHRIVVPKQLRQVVTWLQNNQDALICTLELMPTLPGLELRPREESGAFRESAPNFAAHDAPADSDFRQRLRVEASRWIVRLEKHGATFRFTVPEPVRRMGLLPGAEGSVVLFGCGEIFEIWKPDDWLANLRSLCARDRQAHSVEAVEMHPPRRVPK